MYSWSRREQQRPIDWRGEPTRAALAADLWYRGVLAELGLIERPWTPPPLPYYAACLPDGERRDEP